MHPTQNQPPTTPGLDLSPAEVLRGAAVYIGRHGLHQGDMFANDTTPFPAACVQGAVKMAICGGMDAAYTHEQSFLSDHTLAVLVDYLDTRFHLHIVDDQDEGLSLGDIVANWNDEYDRTHTEVVTALDGAADEYTGRHPGGAR